MYVIQWNNGKNSEHTTYELACDAVRAEIHAPIIGHDGDIEDGGERTLIWDSDTAACNDDGSRAVGEIIMISPIDGYEIQHDASGVGDCWRRKTEHTILRNIHEELASDIMDPDESRDETETDENGWRYYTASNGEKYRWRIKI